MGGDNNLLVRCMCLKVPIIREWVLNRKTIYLALSPQLKKGADQNLVWYLLLLGSEETKGGEGGKFGWKTDKRGESN